MGKVLLAEDEAVSRRYLADALAALGHDCVACGDGDAALAAARAERFDLLLLDYNLPRRRGDALLAELRGQGGAASQGTPAIALTADHDDATGRRLLAAGFARVAHKPLTLAALAELLANQLVTPEARRWDDDAALRATGGAGDIVAALRALMLAELPQQRRSVVEALARDERDVAQDTLHRLRAACGFCGATALAQRVDALEIALRGGDVAGRLAAFEAEVDALLG
jgi:two-component system, OmpR family, response regulator